ncbi:hypothetical protein [Rhodobacter maris]|uniref:hypothetical protein n=1 Tax=Rhodobacter maris TaxID=446682 RepID=UPI001143FBA5|nr:hypothetical protein [Rhodobacter maris]
MPAHAGGAVRDRVEPHQTAVACLQRRELRGNEALLIRDDLLRADVAKDFKAQRVTRGERFKARANAGRCAHMQDHPGEGMVKERDPVFENGAMVFLEHKGQEREGLTRGERGHERGFRKGEGARGARE